MHIVQVVGLGVIGVAGIGYAIRSMSVGVINLGGKHHPWFVAFADQPGLFIFGVLFILLLSAGALLVVWRHFTKPPDSD